MSHKSVPQECSRRVSHKSFLRVSHKSVLQVTHKSVPQECLTLDLTEGLEDRVHVPFVYTRDHAEWLTADGQASFARGTEASVNQSQEEAYAAMAMKDTLSSPFGLDSACPTLGLSDVRAQPPKKDEGYPTLETEGDLPAECPTRVSYKSVVQERPTRVSHKSVPQECPIRVSHKSVPPECPTRVSDKSVPQECPTRVSCKSVPQECPASDPQECSTRVLHKSVPQECPTRVSHKSVPQECPTRVSHKSFLQE